MPIFESSDQMRQHIRNMMKKLISILLLTTLIFGCSGNDKKGMSEFDRSVTLLDEFKFSEAETAFQKLGEMNPTRPIGLLGKAESEERQIRYFDALHYYMTIDDADSALSGSFVGATRVLLRLGLYDDALKEAGLFVQRFPDNPDSHGWLARVCMWAENYARAKTEADKMVDAGGKQNVAEIIKAQASFQMGAFDSSKVQLARGFEMADESPEFFEAVAEYFEFADQADSSIKYSRLSVEAGSALPQFQMEHFHRALRLGWFDEARSVIEGLKAAGAPDTVTVGLKIFYYQGRGDVIEARNTATAYSAIVGHSMSTSYYEMMVRGATGESTPVRQEIMYMQSTMQKENYWARFQEFLNYRILVFMDTQDDEFTTLAGLDGLRGEFGNRMDVRLGRVHLLYRTGQFPEGDKQAELLIKYHQKSPLWMKSLGDLFTRTDVKRYAKAEASYRASLESDSMYLPAFTQFVEMYLGLDQPKKSLKIFEEFPQFEVRFPSAVELKALCQIEAGSVEQGMSTLKTHLSRYHSDYRLCRRVYTAMDEAGELGAMKELAASLTSENPGDFDAYDTSGAYNTAMRMVELNPDDPRGRARLAYVQHMQGNSDPAREELERLIIEYRDDAEVNLWLSRLLADEGEDLQRASNLARRANFSAFMPYRNWMNLCYVYDAYGRSDLCRGEAAKSSRKFKDRPLPYYWMGIAAHREGKSEVSENLNKAIERGLRGDELVKAKTILAAIK